MKLTRKHERLPHDTWNQTNTTLRSMFCSKVLEIFSKLVSQEVAPIWQLSCWKFMRQKESHCLRRAEASLEELQNTPLTLNAGRLTQLMALTGPSGGWRKTMIEKSIASAFMITWISSSWITSRWSAKHGSCPAGDPELHHYIGEILYKGAWSNSGKVKLNPINHCRGFVWGGRSPFPCVGQTR